MNYRISQIVKSGLCTGCGACVALNPAGIKMKWSNDGFLVPNETENYTPHGEERVCPFNPHPEDCVRTENELAAEFQGDLANSLSRIGHFVGTYVGYSKDYRLTSSSGGLATYFSESLLRGGYVDAVVSVHPSDDQGDRFEFAFTTDPEKVARASETKYFPVTYAEVLQRIRNYEGRVAITGVGCFIKSIRLLQHYDPIFREKIVFTIGIICGGLKSAFFSDYLADKAGSHTGYLSPRFRVKDPSSSANDYSYQCIDERTEDLKKIKMRSVGDMWGSGYFKALACDVCDDVTTELADVSLGDAWLPEYQNDGKGQNVIVTRSKLADDLIREGIRSGSLAVTPLPLRDFLRSQRGSFNHRHIALKYRLAVLHSKGVETPPKRCDTQDISWRFKLVQNCRMKTRSQSLKVWREVRNAESFERKMSPLKNRLRILTELYHIDRLPGRIMRKLGLKG